LAQVASGLIQARISRALFSSPQKLQHLHHWCFAKRAGFLQDMYSPGSNCPATPFPLFDTSSGPDAVIAAALASASTTQASAKRAEQAAAAAVAGTGMGQMPSWMSPSPMGGYGSPKFNPPPSERPPGFLKTSSPSTKAVGDGAEKLRLPVKSLRNDADDLAMDDQATLPTKAKSMPAIGEGGDSPLEEGDGPSLGSSLHGTGTCTPCAWFHKADGCLNAKDCRYCHLCPEGELKKRKKQKVAKMRLGLATPKAGCVSPNAQVLSLSGLI